MKLDRTVVITGFMGCGKSEVARCLARRLGVDVVDLDEIITRLERRSPAQLIREEGEREFRKTETRTLTSLLQASKTQVISLGGGAWIESVNREVLSEKNAISVWLDTPFEICWSRIEADQQDRPLGKTRQQAFDLFEQRQSIYELAQVHIRCRGNEKSDEVAGQIEAELRAFETLS